MKSQILDSRSTNTIFLPNFLLGDDPDSLPTYPTFPEISPGSITTPRSFKSTANVIKRRSLRQKLFSESLTEILPPSSPFVSVYEKAGPPKIGLFDRIYKKPAAHLGEPTCSNIPEESLNSRTYLMKETNAYWVTVFGFPSSALNIVLSLLSTCGTIKQQTSSQGNYVRIRFSNFDEVAKALSLNGTFVFGNVTIGVRLYYPRENKKNIVTAPTEARSLRRFSMIAPERYNNVVPGPNVPQKCTDIFSKTIDYVFGW